MKELFSIDLKDYEPDFKIFRRPSARAVIFKDDRLVMVHSQKYDYYKFPGGGIKNDESPVAALIRETAEETGFSVVPETVRELGYVMRKQKSLFEENVTFEQLNYYYLCDIKANNKGQSLDDYEADEGFHVVYVTPEEVIEVNRNHPHGGYDSMLIEREAMVCEYLLQNEI